MKYRNANFEVDVLGVDTWHWTNSAFLRRRQDHRHNLRVDRLDHCVRRRHQEAVDEMRSGDRLRLRASVAFELGPDASEGGQRSAASTPARGIKVVTIPRGSPVA